MSAAKKPASEDLDLVFWPGVLGSLSYADQLEITRIGGLTSIAVNPLLVKQMGEKGVSAEAMRRQAEDQGLRISWLDGMSSWTPYWVPAPSNPTHARYRDRFNFSSEECLDVANALGAAAMVAVPIFEYGSLEEDAVAEMLAEFCDRARPRGLRVDVEYIPFTGLRTPGEASAVVRKSGAGNAGVMVDTWHTAKAPTDFAADLALLSSLPPGMVTGMQLNDSVVPGKVADPLAEIIELGRGFPGEGKLPVAEMIAAVMRAGPLTNVGPEPATRSLLELPIAELGRRAGESTRRAVAAARALMG